jgi:hypothetical protein
LGCLSMEYLELGCDYVETNKSVLK